MKKLLKGIVILVIVVLIIALAGIGYLKFGLPKIAAAKDIKIEATPERIARGKYLAENVNACVDCHSARDWTQFAGPLVKGTEGKGGEKFGKELGFPGNFYSRNITPYGIGDWTDGEVLRAITTGISKDGHSLFPVMPYQEYGKMDEEDIYSLIAYIRTFPSIKNDIPKSEADFPISLLINTMPKEAGFKQKPDPSNMVAYGGYLVNAASCKTCHTKEDKGELIAGTEFGGGRRFDLPGYAVFSANITSHETGIGSWSREAFVKRFKAYVDSSYHSPVLTMNDANSIMPWFNYAGMTESDLGAIYEYLRTQPAIENTVKKYAKR